MDLFRWTMGVAFVLSLATFLLDLLGARVWLQLIIVLVLTIFAVVHGLRKFGVPESAFVNGGIIGLSALAGTLIGSSVQEVLEYIIILVLFAAAYVVAGFVAKLTFGHGRKKQRREESDEPVEQEQSEV